MPDSPSRDDRRRAALQAARTLLDREGPAGVSMRKLASASNMAINTLYALFGTREGVLEALVEDAIGRRVEALSNLDPAAGTPVDRLFSFVTRSSRDAIEHPATAKPMYRAASAVRGLRHAATAVGVDVFTRLLEEAAAEGHLRGDVDLGLLAGIQMQLVSEATLAWALDEIPDEELELRCRHGLAVLLASAATPEAAPAMQRRLRREGEALRTATRAPERRRARRAPRRSKDR